QDHADLRRDESGPAHCGCKIPTQIVFLRRFSLAFRRAFQSHPYSVPTQLASGLGNEPRATPWCMGSPFLCGRDHNGKPVQSSQTVRGSKKDAQRLSAEMTVRPSTSPLQRISIAEMLDLWYENERPSWAPSTERDQLSRIRQVKSDRIASVLLSRLTAVEVDRWHSRLTKRGVGEGSIRNQHLVLRASVTLAVRWGWIPANVVAIARAGARRSPGEHSRPTRSGRLSPARRRSSRPGMWNHKRRLHFVWRQSPAPEGRNSPPSAGRTSTRDVSLSIPALPFCAVAPNDPH